MVVYSGCKVKYNFASACVLSGIKEHILYFEGRIKDVGLLAVPITDPLTLDLSKYQGPRGQNLL